MKVTKIIMDSTSDLPKDIIDQHGIDVLPLKVLVDNEEYLDKLTISVDQVYKLMKVGICPKTSLPNPKDIYDLFKGYAAKNQDFIYFAFSSKLSSTYETCYLVIEELKKDYPHVNMGIIDSRGGSFATGLIVWQAAQLAEAGLAFQEIMDISQDNVDNVEHIFTIDDLSWLVKGGRIKKTEGVIGDALKIKPILDVQDGEMVVIKKVRGRKRALKTVVDLVAERAKEFPDQVIGITHADDYETALDVKEMIANILGHDKILIEKIGGVLGSHLGIGGVGIFFLRKPAKEYII